MPNNLPETVSDYYPSKWLKTDDLGDSPVTIKIESVQWEKTYNLHERTHESKLTIAFEGAKKRLIPNKTQCEAIWAIAQTEKFAEWVGTTIKMAVGTAPNNKPTIVISAPPPEQNAGK